MSSSTGCKLPRVNDEHYILESLINLVVISRKDSESHLVLLFYFYSPLFRYK